MKLDKYLDDFASASTSHNVANIGEFMHNLIEKYHLEHMQTDEEIRYIITNHVRRLIIERANYWCRIYALDFINTNAHTTMVSLYDLGNNLCLNLTSDQKKDSIVKINKILYAYRIYQYSHRIPFSTPTPVSLKSSKGIERGRGRKLFNEF